MCYVDWGERADVWDEQAHEAQREYRCAACGLTIRRRTVYVNLRTLFEGEWQGYPMHHDCWELSQYIQKVLCNQDLVYPPDGDLREQVREHMEADPELLRKYRHVLRARIREGVWTAPRV